MNTAVIKTGGKQYLVSPGTVLTIEIMRDKAHVAGDTISFTDVLMKDAGSLLIGTPTVSGAVVKGTVLSVGKAKKIDVVRFKAKSNYHKRRGHRQPEMKVKIDSIA